MSDPVDSLVIEVFGTVFKQADKASEVLPTSGTHNTYIAQCGNRRAYHQHSSHFLAGWRHDIHRDHCDEKYTNPLTTVGCY